MKSLKFVQKIGIITLLVIALFSILLFWYKKNEAVEASQTSKFNSSQSVQKLLIAKHASPFKDAITAKLVVHYQVVPIIVEVIDIADLVNADAGDFDVILILHRWEAGAPPAVVQEFMAKNSKLKNKIVVLTTSWNGQEKMKNVDAITGASMFENEPVVTNKIIKSIDRQLKYKK